MYRFACDQAPLGLQALRSQKTMCFWILSKSIVAPPLLGPKRLQNEPIYMKEVKSETRRPKSQNASYQKRANSASSKRANASTTGGCTNRHTHRHSVQPSLQRSHDIAHRTLLIEPLRSTTDAETQHNATQPVAPTAVAYNNVASNAACTLVQVLAHIALQMEQPQYIWSQKKNAQSVATGQH